jgi:hypothetical protein
MHACGGGEMAASDAIQAVFYPDRWDENLGDKQHHQERVIEAFTLSVDIPTASFAPVQHREIYG